MYTDAEWGYLKNVLGIQQVVLPKEWVIPSSKATEKVITKPLRLFLTPKQQSAAEVELSDKILSSISSLKFLSNDLQSVKISSLPKGSYVLFFGEESEKELALNEVLPYLQPTLISDVTYLKLYSLAEMLDPTPLSVQKKKKSQVWSVLKKLLPQESAR